MKKDRQTVTLRLCENQMEIIDSMCENLHIQRADMFEIMIAVYFAYAERRNRNESVNHFRTQKSA
jgi:hypothetical protein